MGAPGGTGTGTGAIGDGFYRRYLGSALEQMIRANNRLNRRVFSADVAIWVGAAGKVTRAEIVRSRSEEHTSELQSLMRISYAVFCLKKKTYKQTHNNPRE